MTAPENNKINDIPVCKNVQTIGDLRRWLDDSGLSSDTEVSVVGLVLSDMGERFEMEETLFDVKYNSRYKTVEIHIGSV